MGKINRTSDFAFLFTVCLWKKWEGLGFFLQQMRQLLPKSTEKGRFRFSIRSLVEDGFLNISFQALQEIKPRNILPCLVSFYHFVLNQNM